MDFFGITYFKPEIEYVMMWLFFHLWLFLDISVIIIGSYDWDKLNWFWPTQIEKDTRDSGHLTATSLSINIQ